MKLFDADGNLKVNISGDAANIDITDAGGIITATEVEAALQEIVTDLNGFPDELKNLTATEIAELEAIGATTISAAQWGILGAAVEWTDWTPTLTGGADLSGFDVARYYRVGDLCFFTFIADNKNITTAGIIQITLPFTAANIASAKWAPSAQVKDGVNWIGLPYITISTNQNYMEVYKDVALTNWVGTETTVYIRMSGFFEIA